MSKPATQNMTAAVSNRIWGSSVPRTAIQAAAGAMPRENPKTKCDQRVTRLVYEYNRTTARATGESSKVNRFSCQAARTNTAQDITTNTATNSLLNTPAGRARDWVRGLAASIDTSASRLN